MDTGRFDNLLRGLGAGMGRRGVLAGVTAALAMAVPRSLGIEETAARKEKKKKGGAPPPTCAQLCPADAECASRAADSTLCGSGSFLIGCTPCSSDQDCLGVTSGGSRKPYCLTAITTRTTGETRRTTGAGAPFCPGTASPGVCADTFA